MNQTSVGPDFFSLHICVVPNLVSLRISVDGGHIVTVFEMSDYFSLPKTKLPVYFTPVPFGDQGNPHSIHMLR